MELSLLKDVGEIEDKFLKFRQFISGIVDHFEGYRRNSLSDDFIKFHLLINKMDVEKFTSYVEDIIKKTNYEIDKYINKPCSVEYHKFPKIHMNNRIFLDLQPLIEKEPLLILHIKNYFDDNMTDMESSRHEYAESVVNNLFGKSMTMMSGVMENLLQGDVMGEMMDVMMSDFVKIQDEDSKYGPKIEEVEEFEN